MHKLRGRILTNYSNNGTGLQILMNYKVFRDTYKFLKKSQWWSKELLEKHQMQELNKLLQKYLIV